MKGTPLMLGLLLVSIASLGLVTTAVEGCGQGVPTCASVCALGSEAADCEASCSALQTTSGTAYPADFQAYLTCNSNAGGFTAGAGSCAAITKTVWDEADDVLPGSGTGVGTGTSTATFSVTGTTTGTTVVVTPPGPGPQCSSLEACCNNLPLSSQSSCEAIAQVGDEPSCASALDEAAASGFCLGISTPPTPLCALGSPCDATSENQCTLSGAGPCSSDVTLICGPMGSYIVGGFPCGSSTSCGFGSGSCSESCDCTSGQMVCTGDCPDGGLASP